MDFFANVVYIFQSEVKFITGSVNGVNIGVGIVFE